MERRVTPLRNQTEHDVIIVGASIAGCRTARTLAGAGIPVLLLDRAEFPRWKPCAGGLTLKARPYLSGPLWDRVETTMTSAFFTWGRDYVTHLQSRGPLGWMVHRESFDEAHLELARSQPGVTVALGVAVREVEESRTGVRLETNRGPLEARVVVGADGAKSVVSRAVPGHGQRLLGFAYEGEAWPGQDREPLTHEAWFDFRTFPHGYGWIFPKTDHYSIGGFIYRRTLPGIKDRYREFCRENPYLRGAETFRTRGHPIALGGSRRPLNTRRILLAGEAGDLVDPLTGEGIYFALRSGHLAGEAVARFLEKGTSLDAYSAQVRREIQEDLHYGRVLADIFFRHPKLAYHLVFQNELLCRWFAEIRAGTRSYQDMVRKAVTKGLFLPLHSRFSQRIEVELERVG